MVANLLGRKSDAFADLLDGPPADPSAVDPALVQLSRLVQRLSSVPAPAAPFREGLRDQLIAAGTHATVTLHPPDGGSALHAPAGQGAGTTGAGSAAPAGTGAAGSTAGGAAGAGGTAGAAGSGAAGAGAAGTSAAATASAGATAAGGVGGLGAAVGTAVTTVAKTAPLWAKLFIAGTAVAVSGTGVGVSADRALPGDFFYGVKKQVEAVQLDLASGARDKALTQLGIAHARANEIKALIAREHVVPGKPLSAGVAKDIRSALENWAENAGEGTTSLVKQIRALGSAPANALESAKLRRTLDEFTTQQFTQLGTTLADLPTGTVQSLTVSALGYLQRVDRVLGGTTVGLVQALSDQLPVPLASIQGIRGLGTVLHLPAGITGVAQAIPAPPAPLSGGGAAVIPPLAALSSLPGLPVPQLVPKVQLPPLKLPSVTLRPGSLPGVSVPGASLPGVKLPGVTVPGVSLPGVSVPPLRVPTVPLPSLSVPSVVGGLRTALPSAVQSLGGRLLGGATPVPLPTGAVSKTLDDVDKAVGKTVDKGVAGVSKTVGDVGTTVSQTVDGLGGTVSQTVDGVGNAVESLGGDVPGTVKNLGATTGTTVENLGGTVDKSLDGVTKTATGVGETVDETVRDLGRTVEDLGQTVPEVGKAAPDVAKNVPDVGQTVDGVTAPIADPLGSVTGGLTSTSGPSLPLPTTVPALPALPDLGSLGGLGGLGG